MSSQAVKIVTSKLCPFLLQDLRVLSLLFTANAPQKADVSEMLVPSLKRLLGVCRKHQKAKQSKLNEQKDGEKTENTKADENKSVKDESKKDKDEGNNESEKRSGDDDHPPTKRRRGESVATSSEVEEASTCATKEEESKEQQGTSTGESSKGKKVAQTVGTKAKCSGQLIRKKHSDWVDSLAKIIESVMSKVPK